MSFSLQAKSFFIYIFCVPGPETRQADKKGIESLKTIQQAAAIISNNNLYFVSDFYKLKIILD